MSHPHPSNSSCNSEPYVHLSYKVYYMWELQVYFCVASFWSKDIRRSHPLQLQLQPLSHALLNLHPPWALWPSLKETFLLVSVLLLFGLIFFIFNAIPQVKYRRFNKKGTIIQWVSLQWEETKKEEWKMGTFVAYGKGNEIFNKQSTVWASRVPTAPRFLPWQKLNNFYTPRSLQYSMLMMSLMPSSSDQT